MAQADGSSNGYSSIHCELVIQHSLERLTESEYSQPHILIAEIILVAALRISHLMMAIALQGSMHKYSVQVGIYCNFVNYTTSHLCLRAYHGYVVSSFGS